MWVFYWKWHVFFVDFHLNALAAALFSYPIDFRCGNNSSCAADLSKRINAGFASHSAFNPKIIQIKFDSQVFLDAFIVGTGN